MERDKSKSGNAEHDGNMLSEIIKSHFVAPTTTILNQFSFNVDMEEPYGRTIEKSVRFRLIAPSNLCIWSAMKTLDVNKYATKKTIAQGLLDVALLTANASQLKYVLQVGEKHEFYVLMLTLISISIVLQIVQASLCVILGSSLNINDEGDHPSASKTNDIVMCTNIVIMAVNILISSFEMRESNPDDTATTAIFPVSTAGS